MRKPEEVKFKRTTTLIVSIVVISVLLLGTITYIIFFKQRVCNDLECFQEASLNCLRASYLNEDPTATWKYKILGMEGDDCRIKVTLVSATQGELGISRLEGESMVCYVQGSTSYPEKDLKVCHGLLKEDLLDIIITKLHTYIINNLGKVDANLQGIV